jgi:signal transduction histidine kinase
VSDLTPWLAGWGAALAALGIVAGWWLSRSGYHSGLRELEAYLLGWTEGKREGEERALRAAEALRRRKRWKPIYETLDEHRRSYLSLRSFSAETSERLQKLIDVLSDAVLVYDREGRLLFASGRLRELALAKARGQPAPGAVEELRQVEEFLDVRSDLGEFVRDCLAAGSEPGGREVAVASAEGERRFFATPHLIRDPAGESDLGLLLLLTDVEVLEEARRNGLRQVELDHCRLASELMAHRVRNPLNSIVLVLELIRRESARAGGGSLGKNLETIQADVGRLEVTLQRFLEMMRHRERKPESVDLVAVVETVSELLYPVAREAGVDVRQELRVSSAPVHGDRIEITRAVLGPGLAAIRAAAPDRALRFRLDSERRGYLLWVESEGFPARSVALVVAEELTARNGGSLTYDDPDRPTRLAYRFGANG